MRVWDIDTAGRWTDTVDCGEEIHRIQHPEKIHFYPSAICVTPAAAMSIMACPLAMQHAEKFFERCAVRPSNPLYNLYIPVTVDR